MTAMTSEFNDGLKLSMIHLIHSSTKLERKKNKLLLALLLYTILTTPLSAQGIDEVFTKSFRQTWGEWFSSLFQRQDFNKSYAIVIGISQFNEFQNLGTQNDPIRMKDYLINEAGFDYVRLITGNQVNLNKIRSIMVNEMPRYLGANDRFLFYWSGHGATANRNGKQFGYLPVANSRKGDFSTMLDMNTLAQWDNQLSAKQTFYLLDACYSGTAGFRVMSDGKAQTVQQIARPSRQILTAGLANEETIVIDRLGGSVFTTAVLDGLRGAADTSYPNLPKDGIVSARELEVYVKRRVGSEVANSTWKKSITPLLTRLTHNPGDFFFMSEGTIGAAPTTKALIASRQSSVSTMSGRASISLKPQRVESTPEPGMKIIRLPNDLNLIKIPAGKFRMGSNNGKDNEKPVRTVTIPRPFWISETEITFAQYDQYAIAKDIRRPDDEGWGRKSRPVIDVSLFDAKNFAHWLSGINSHGLQCRLPSESEWEYVARGGNVNATNYSWGNTIGVNRAHCYGCGNIISTRSTAPVKSFPKNGFDIYDMHGNVDEWVLDCWHGNYRGAPNNGSVWSSAECAKHVIRGGSLIDEPINLRSSARFKHDPNIRLPHIGFRLVCQ